MINKRAWVVLILSAICVAGAYRFTVAPSANESEENEHGDPGYFRQWFDRHKNEQGVIPSGLQTGWLKDDRSRRSFSKNAGHIDTVLCMGPFTQGGRTRALLVSSADSNLIFAGAMSGGMWKSTNGGTSWTQINDAAVSLAVSCVTENPFNPDEIYYGTGESRSNSAGVPGDGIFKSSDRGNTFAQVPSTVADPALDYIWSIEHSRTNDSTIYAGTNTGGMYRSTDRGVTWNQLSGTSGSVTDIATFNDGKVMFGMKNTGIFMSMNGNPNSFAKIVSPAFPASFQRVEIAYCYEQPQVIFAAFELVNSYSNPGLAGMCKSSDGGATWTSLALPSMGNTFDTYCIMLGVSPNDTNKLIVGGSGSRGSTNGGLAWSSAPTVHADHHVAVPLHPQSKYFLVGTDGGLCRKHWDSLSATSKDLNAGYVTTQYYGGDFNVTGSITVGGMQDNGSWRVSKTGVTKVNGADGGYAHISQQDPNLAYVSTQNGAVYKSTNFTGASPNFNAITPPASTEPKDFINFYQINYADGNQLYYRTATGIWRTTTAGSSWTKLNTATIPSIQTIGCTEEANPTLYLGGPSRLFRIDQAATFTPGTFKNFSSTVPHPHPMGSITVHPHDPTTLFVGFTSYDTMPRAYMVVNAKDTPRWINISGDLPSRLAVNQIQPDPDKPSSHFYAATDFGMYYTADTGHTWLKETRIPNVVIYEMKLRKSDSKLFLFTHGRGVWYLSLQRTPNTGVSKAAESSKPLRLFPNPCTDRIFIGPGGSEPVHCTIYTLSGLAVLEDEIMAENGTATLNVDKLPAGVYLMRTRIGKMDHVSKFVKH